MATEKSKLYKNILMLIVLLFVGIAIVVSCFIHIHQFNTCTSSIVIFVGVGLTVYSLYTIAADYLNLSYIVAELSLPILISFIMLAICPFMAIYHCENNKCTWACYAVTYTIQMKDLHIDENTKYIGINDIENSDLYNYREKNNFINNITINHDILNLEKFKNNSSGRIKLYSIYKLILFPICLVIISGIFLSENKQLGKYLLILLLLVIVRFLYIFAIALW